MNIFIMLSIAIINIITVLSVCYRLKGLEKKKQIGFLAIGFGGIYLLVAIIYFLSTIGIESKELLAYTKQLITFTFVPVNATISLNFLAKAYAKFINKKIKAEQFKKTVIKIVVILIVANILEFFYFRDLNQSIIKMAMETKGV